MSCEHRFLLDASLAGLARWLRLLGYDSSVYEGEAGRPMMRRALSENRIILTRRSDMPARQFSGRLLLLPQSATGFQVRFVVDKLSLILKRNKMYSLCVCCNVPVRSIAAPEVRDCVPAYVFDHCQEYHICDQCRKVYWKGSHPRNAERFLEENGVQISDE